MIYVIVHKEGTIEGLNTERRRVKRLTYSPEEKAFPLHPHDIAPPIYICSTPEHNSEAEPTAISEHVSKPSTCKLSPSA